MADEIQPITHEEVEAFVARCQALINDYYARNYQNVKPPFLSVMYGDKNARVVAQNADSTSRSCWCFVSLENGDVLKSDGWKRPAKHARGNIRDEHKGMKFVSHNGPAYLK